MNDRQENIKKLVDKLNLKLNNFDIFENAFVHRSYLNEHPKFHLDNNERLEFLGDAVLELVTTRYLYDNYQKPEGELTALRSALVRGKNLSQIAQELEVEQCLYLSSGEAQGSPKAKSLILANALEAIIGSIYLDLGYDVARGFIEKYILKNISKIIDERLYIDAKSSFQEKSQEKFKLTPQYKVLDQSGPDHNKIFKSGVFLEDKMVATGEGSSKNSAEQEAAKNALDELFSQLDA